VFAPRVLGTWSGVGLVIANMIGAGVFLSAGFMAQDMGPGLIMLAWTVGAVIAMAGARAYAELAIIIPRSGGEYRFLSDLLHPAVGYLAGWASLLIGFSAPIAIDALAAGAFLNAIMPTLDPRLTGVVILVALALAHAVGFRSSIQTQNSLIGIKVLLIAAFIVAGLVVGNLSWPDWTAPQSSGTMPLAAFATSLFYIAFAFSGWNAAVYISEEFRQPTRSVPRSLLIGCGFVAVLYLMVNYILIANVTPVQAQVVFDYERTRVTLGHLVSSSLLGNAGGVGMSLLAAVAFISAISAMMMAGPRVYAAMAQDGFLPRWFVTPPNAIPRRSVILQAVIALMLLFTHSLQSALQNAGAVLAFFTGLTVLTLFVVYYARPALPRPRRGALIAAAIHGVSALSMFIYGVLTSSRLVIWIAITTIVAFSAYALSTRKRSVQ
jgi:APA family basic amino acid/polyamine antiporter